MDLSGVRVLVHGIHCLTWLESGTYHERYATSSTSFRSSWSVVSVAYRRRVVRVASERKPDYLRDEIIAGAWYTLLRGSWRRVKAASEGKTWTHKRWNRSWGVVLFVCGSKYRRRDAEHQLIHKTYNRHNKQDWLRGVQQIIYSTTEPQLGHPWTAIAFTASIMPLSTSQMAKTNRWTDFFLFIH